MKYTVEVSSQARWERREALRFWQHKAKRARVKAQIQSTINSLGEGFIGYPLVELEPWRSRGIHRAVAGDYNIFYQIFPEDKKVIVLHVIHGARDLSKFL